MKMAGTAAGWGTLGNHIEDIQFGKRKEMLLNYLWWHLLTPRY